MTEGPGTSDPARRRSRRARIARAGMSPATRPAQAALPASWAPPPGTMAPMTPVRAPTMALLRERREEILAVAARHGASNVRIYGSVARGETRPTSDIDVIVDMEAGRSLLDLAALHVELEDLLGFPVEIGTDVRPRLRERVQAEAVSP